MMKKSDFVQVIELARKNKMSKLEVIHLMYAIQKAIREEDTKTDEIWKYFKGRIER